MKELKEHQKRVIEERDELQIKIEKLIKFVQSELLALVSKPEQERLQRQLTIMQDYRRILNERIDNF